MRADGSSKRAYGPSMRAYGPSVCTGFPQKQANLAAKRTHFPLNLLPEPSTHAELG